MPEVRGQKPEVRGQRSENTAGRFFQRTLIGFFLFFCFLNSDFCDLAHATELKIGYVAIGKIFDGYERTKQNDAVLEKRGKAKEAELEARVNDLKKMRQNLELLNDAAREAKAREIEERSDELQRFRKNTARELQRDRDKIAQEILCDIQRTIDDFAKANGFALVLDQRSLVFAQPVYDVTDAVLQLLNSRSAAPSVPAPAAAKPAARQ